MNEQEYVKTKAEVLEGKFKLLDFDEDLDATRPFIIRPPNIQDKPWRVLFSMPDFSIRHLNTALEEGFEFIEVNIDCNNHALDVLFEIDLNYT